MKYLQEIIRVWVESTYQNEISAFMLVNGYFLVAGLSQSWGLLLFFSR